MDQFPQFLNKIVGLALHFENPLYNYIRNVPSRCCKMTITVGQLHPIRLFSL